MMELNEELKKIGFIEVVDAPCCANCKHSNKKTDDEWNIYYECLNFDIKSSVRDELENSGTGWCKLYDRWERI